MKKRKISKKKTAMLLKTSRTQVDRLHWPLASLQQRLVKAGGRLIKHARSYWLLAESLLTRRLLRDTLRRIAALPSPGG